jgi:acylphosphatase
MKKCLKISFGVAGSSSLMGDIHKKGAKLGIEGTIQVVSGNELRIIVCGLKDQVDKFVDLLHKEAAQAGITDLNIEPFVKAKDYRGAFRVIE